MGMVNRTLIKQALQHTAGQLEPSLSNLEHEVGRSLEPVSFALGMMAAALAMQRMDLVAAARLMGEDFTDFIAEVEKRHPRDLGPYSDGVLTTGYYNPEWGMRFDPGQAVKWRVATDRFVEVMFPPFDGTLLRLLDRAQVESAS